MKFFGYIDDWINEIIRWQTGMPYYIQVPMLVIELIIILAVIIRLSMGTTTQ